MPRVEVTDQRVGTTGQRVGTTGLRVENTGPRVENSGLRECVQVDLDRLSDAVRRTLAQAGILTGSVSVAVLDDPAIHALNRQWLAHDYPTDVLSFLLERSPSHLEGEILVSAETAQRSAAAYGWATNDELLLYVIHGALHLVGYQDGTPEERANIRAAEASLLAEFGLKPHV